MLTLDKARVAQRFSQSLTTYDQQAVAQQQINRQLIQLLLQQEKRHFAQLLEIGCGTGQLTALLKQHFSVTQWHLNDLCAVQPRLQTLLAGEQFHFFQGDAESICFPKGYDLIASASTVQWFSDPKAFIAQCAAKLRPRGLLLLSTFAPQNLQEIRHLTGIGLTCPDRDCWRDWLTPHFEILHLSQRDIPLYFASPMAVLQHLKATGVTAVRRENWTKSKLQHFLQHYQQHYAVEAKKVRLTYQPIFIFARKKEEK
ncbi:MAG: malonyl-ACP O-methyltransferase BioC [[Pasteurella] mairii]|uniref:Malonyl-[acyl-carrier protein] O-methyltransferase n=1 Tax=[Pasteurella] mairii TaxID=757 RepID=A0A379B6C1_9PAST|nr:malonyl-ACP O-methyltransferase BioC [[Pasteurella] mairii]SUB33818.1 biotin synthesis protein BioC [[Pasteurella] mairii]